MSPTVVKPPAVKAPRVNRAYITLPDYILDPRYLNYPLICPGLGIDLGDPFNPKVAPYHPFLPPEQAEEALMASKKGMDIAEPRGLEKSSVVIQETTTLKEGLTESEESSVLSAFFKASYGLSSINASMTAAREERKSFHTIYSLLEYSGEAERLASQHLDWKNVVPVPNSITDPDEALFEFISRYGSHYVSAMSYGLRIAIQGKVRKDSKTSSLEFATAFKAAFGSFSAQGGVRSEQKSKFEQMSVDLLLEVTSGGRKGSGLLSMRNFDDISTFLEDIKQERTKFSVAPIRIFLYSYRETLKPEWRTLRKALDPRSAIFTVPQAIFGVPRGTILPWYPPSEYLQQTTSKKDAGSQPETPVRIVPPDGWAICDGTLGTPDLRDRFIRGTAEPAHLNATGGADRHNHGGSTRALDTSHSDWWWKADTDIHHRGLAGVDHQHPLDSCDHLPPYTMLVYIMKV